MIDSAEKLLSNVVRILVELGEAIDGSYAERVAVLSLYADGETQMSTLAQRVGMSRGAMTSIADRLEDQGFVERALSREDRRIVLVRITESGTDAVNGAILSLEEETVS